MVPKFLDNTGIVVPYILLYSFVRRRPRMEAGACPVRSGRISGITLGEKDHCQGARGRVSDESRWTFVSLHKISLACRQMTSRSTTLYVLTFDVSFNGIIIAPTL